MKMKRISLALAMAAVFVAALVGSAFGDSLVWDYKDIGWSKMGKDTLASQGISLAFAGIFGASAPDANGDTTKVINLPNWSNGPTPSSRPVMRVWFYSLNPSASDSIRAFVIVPTCANCQDYTYGPIYAQFSGDSTLGGKAGFFNLATSATTDSLIGISQFRLVFQNFDGSRHAALLGFRARVYFQSATNFPKTSFIPAEDGPLLGAADRPPDPLARDIEEELYALLPR